MTESDLRPYIKLYQNSRYMGANILFRSFYGLPADAVVPLSVAHGVDFGHCHSPMDVPSIEPIHWSCNAVMHEAASRVKPSLLLPHPWVMQTSHNDPPRGRGVLVIGPPPSPTNDAALYELIRKDVRDDWAILVKARGAYQPSMQYWAERGIQPLTASGSDSLFYARLFDLLSRYETIVGCTFSSALVFAASIGKRVQLIQGYTYQAYEPADYETEVNHASVRASTVVKTFVDANRGVTRDLSRDLLGFDNTGDRDVTVRRFHEMIETLSRPFYNDPTLAIPYALRQTAAMKFNKSKILQASLKTYFSYLRRTNMCIMTINEFDIWLNGKSQRNFSLAPVLYVPGVTEPGIAPEGYK